MYSTLKRRLYFQTFGDPCQFTAGKFFYGNRFFFVFFDEDDRETGSFLPIEYMHDPLLYESIRRYAVRLLSDPDAAQDVAQEVILRFQQNRTEIRNERSWAYRTARNLIVDQFRRSGKFGEAGNEIPAEATRFDPAIIVEKKETMKMIHDKVNNLPPRHREVLRLKFQEGLKYAEIAEVIGEPITTVGWLLHESLQKLRRDLVPQTTSD